MFKKIRRNFIVISMMAVSLVLIVSTFAINYINYRSVETNCDQIIDSITKSPDGIGFDSRDRFKVGDNRYFIADLKNNEIQIITMKVDSLSKDAAIEYCEAVKNSTARKGYYGNYRYRIIDKDKIIFLDCTNRLIDRQRFLLISVLSSFGGLIIIFFIVFFGSNIVLKPVKESYDKQKEFITNASHNLKTPLTIISANNELIEMKKGPSEYTENISNEVNKMNTMIKEFISYSKMQENQKPKKEEFNLSSLVTNTVNEFKILFEDLNLEFETDIQQNITIQNDPELIRQMLSILLDNARKYALKNIKISLTKNKRTINLIQSNDGEEIPDGDLSYFADRFYRSSSNKTQEGSGIGLSLLKELCNKTKVKLQLFGENDRFNATIEF